MFSYRSALTFNQYFATCFIWGFTIGYFTNVETGVICRNRFYGHGTCAVWIICLSYAFIGTDQCFIFQPIKYSKLNYCIWGQFSITHHFIWGKLLLYVMSISTTRTSCPPYFAFTNGSKFVENIGGASEKSNTEREPVEHNKTLNIGIKPEAYLQLSLQC